MRKKMIPLMLASVMTMSLIGCSNNNNNEDSTSGNDAPATNESVTKGKINFDEEPYTIKVNYPVLGQEQPDLSKIEAKVNELTLKEINAKVDLVGVNFASMANVYALQASSREKADLMFLLPGSGYLATFANNKMIQPIDKELEEWGADLKETLGDLIDAGQFKGKQFAIPQEADTVTTLGINMNKSILDKYNIDYSSIKTIDDMDAVFATVHAGEPDMIMIAPEYSALTISTGLMYGGDSFNNIYGALMDGNDTKLVNVFESEQWISTVKKVREWYQKGYISKDVNTSQDDGSTLLNQGKVFSTSAYSVGFTGGYKQPVEVVSVALHQPVRTTSSSQTFLWSVASSSERPDKAVQFLNFLNSSEELTTLLSYGIEGEHYEVNSDGTVDTSKNANYSINDWPLFGDLKKRPFRQNLVEASGLPFEQFKAKLKEWNDSVTLSPGYGFVFDPEPVKTEISALDAVTEQYSKVVSNGSVDPDKMIKEFNDKLYAAGLQKVIDEKQRQFDAWLATK